MRQFAAFVLMVLALIGAGPVSAQQAGNTQSALELGTVISPVLIIDRERMLRDSAFGKRLIAEDQARLEELDAENRQIGAELAVEEQDLTLKRPDMEADAFRLLADAFDEKVQRTEKAQIAKNRALSEVLAKEEALFFQAAEPVLKRLMNAAQAAVILERRSVFVSDSRIDITDRAIALLDETIGSGVTSD